MRDRIGVYAGFWDWPALPTLLLIAVGLLAAIVLIRGARRYPSAKPDKRATKDP